VEGDYDGDSLTDVAVFTPSTATWSMQRSSLGNTSVQFGASGDIPVPADYDGDGLTDVAVFRPSDATWYIVNSADNSVTTTQWGKAMAKPRKKVNWGCIGLAFMLFALFNFVVYLMTGSGITSRMGHEVKGGLAVLGSAAFFVLGLLFIGIWLLLKMTRVRRN
jgi:hypothetical protein